MSNDQALTVRPDDYLPSGSDLANMLMVADHVAKSGITPHKTASAVLSVMLTGMELGIKPMAAQRLIHNINGRTSISAELAAGLIQRDHGGDALIYETPDEKKMEQATYSYRRRDWPAGMRKTFTFTVEMAKRAGLIKDEDKTSNWAKHRDAMLRARCVTAIGRIAFADTLLGMLTDDEAEEIAASRVIDITPDEAEEAGVIESSPRIVEMAGGKRADAATGEVIDGPVPAPADPHAALRAEVTALLRTNSKVLAALEAQGKADTSTWTESALLAMRKRLRESERPTPRQALTEAEEIELAIERATTLGEMDELLQRIAALPEGTAQARLDAIHGEKYERMAEDEKAEPLPAFTAR
jgi:hypothetical protein